VKNRLLKLGMSLLLVLYTISAAAQGNWQMKQSAFATIYYRTGEGKNASEVLTAIADNINDIQAELGVRLPYTPQLYLTTSQAEFDRITGGLLPEWSEGVSSAGTGQIVLKSPSFSKTIAEVKQTAIHELTHLMIAQKTGNNIPRWLNEGLAQLLANQMQGESKLLISRALWSGSLLPLRDVDYVDRMPQKNAELAYSQSFNAAAFLVQTYGWKSLRNLLSALGQNQSTDEAFYQVYQFDHAGFESLWVQHLQKSTKWMILLDTQLYIFTGATILVLLSGIMVLRRRRQAYRRWELEETSYTGTI